MDKLQVQTNPIVRALENPTRSKAIHAMCCQCMGCTVEHLEPGFRRDIRDCASTGCPLHKFRPFQTK
jgi:hypothetical protein